MAPRRKRSDEGSCTHPEFTPNFDTQQLECTKCGKAQGTVGTSSSSRTGWWSISRSPETVPTLPTVPENPMSPPPDTAATPPSNSGVPPRKPDPEAAAKALIELGTLLGNAFKKRQPSKPQKGQDRTLSLWALGLVPVVFACLHIMIVSRGDAQTLRSLVQNLNVTALVLAIVLPLGSTILLWVFLAVLGATTQTPKDRRKNAWQTTIILGLITAFVAFFAMPVHYLIVNAVILAIFLLFTLASRWTLTRTGWWVAPARKFFTASAFVWALIFLIGPLMIWLGFLGVWMPQERLSLTTGSLEPVYVLSEDERWTKYMDDDHKVHIVPTRDVKSRQMVASPTSSWRKPPYALWQDWSWEDTAPIPTAPATAPPRQNSPTAPAPAPTSASTPPPAPTASNSPPPTPAPASSHVPLPKPTSTNQR